MKNKSKEELEQLLHDALAEISALNNKGRIDILVDNVSYQISISDKTYIIDIKNDILYKVL